MSKLNKILFGLTVIFSFCFILIITVIYHYVCQDGVQYLSSGYNLIHNGIYESPYGVVPSWAQSPFFPITIGVISLFIPLIYSGKVVGIISGILLLYLLYKFIKSEFNEKIAWITITVLAINVLFMRQILITTTEPLYAVLNFGLFLLLYKIYFKRTEISLKLIVLVAFLSTLLLLTRTEGVLYIFISFIILLKTRKFSYALIYSITVAVLIIPYGIFIESKIGKFNIFPKIKYNQMIGQFTRSIVSNHPELQYDEELVTEIAWYSLDSLNNNVISQSFLNKNFKFGVVPYTELESYSSEKKSTKDFILFRNIKETISVLIIGYEFPIIFFIFILIGIVNIFFHHRKFLYFLIIWILPSFYFIISHVEGRFLFALLPFCSILVAFSIIYLLDMLKLNEKYLYVAITLLLINNTVYYYYLVNFLSQNEKYYSLASELKNDLSAGEKICSKNYSISFFMGLDFRKLPVCNPKQLYKYLSANEVKYLILGNEVYNFRKEFLSIYDLKWKDYFSHLYSYKFKNEEFKIFEVN